MLTAAGGDRGVTGVTAGFRRWRRMPRPGVAVADVPAKSPAVSSWRRGAPRAARALSPTELRRNRARGLPRRTAGHWTALARLVEPLDAARAGLHHDEDVRYRRAGAHAAASSCSTAPPRAGPTGGGRRGTGRRSAAPRRGVPRRATAADRDDGAAVRDRAGLPARRLHRLPAPGQLQPAAPGRSGVRHRDDRGGDEPGRRGAAPLGLSQRPPTSTGCPACSARRC